MDVVAPPSELFGHGLPPARPARDAGDAGDVLVDDRLWVECGGTP